jgi:hypothetical protein
MILRRPKISKVAKMAANCFLKHENPFWYDPNTRMLDRINVMKLKYVDQSLDLDINPRKMTISGSPRSKGEQEWKRLKGKN